MRDQCAKYWLRQDRISLLALVCIGLVSVYLLPGCGGGGGGSGGSSIPSELTTTITGTVYAPDGVTRVAGAIVYVPDPSRASRAAGDSAPPEPAITWTVSGSNGNFVLTDVPAGTVTIKMVTEQFSHAVEVSINTGQTVTLPKASTTMSVTIDDAPPDPFGSGGDEELDLPPSGPLGNSMTHTGSRDSGDAPPQPPIDLY